MRRVPRKRRLVAAPSSLRDMRAYWMLRQLAESALSKAFSCCETRGRRELRTRRNVVLQFWNGGVCRRSGSAGSAALAPARASPCPAPPDAFQAIGRNGFIDCRAAEALIEASELEDGSAFRGRNAGAAGTDCLAFRGDSGGARRMGYARRRRRVFVGRSLGGSRTRTAPERPGDAVNDV